MVDPSKPSDAPPEPDSKEPTPAPKESNDTEVNSMPEPLGPDQEAKGNPYLVDYSNKQKERKKADEEAGILDDAQAIDIANREAEDRARTTAKTKQRVDQMWYGPLNPEPLNAASLREFATEENRRRRDEPAQPAASWGKVIAGVITAFLLFFFAITAAYQTAGVTSVWVAHSMIVAGWLLFMISIGIADYYSPLTRTQKISVLIIGGVVAAVFAIVADFNMVHLKASQDTQTSIGSPDISLQLVYPSAFAVMLVNESDVVLREPKYAPAIWDLDREQWQKPLPIPIWSGDWIGKRGRMGPTAFMAQPEIAPLVKKGDRIVGVISVTCPTCVRPKAYWVYAVHGVGGWFYEQGQGIDINAFFRELPEVRKDAEKYFSNIPKDKRKAIIG